MLGPLKKAINCNILLKIDMRYFSVQYQQTFLKYIELQKVNFGKNTVEYLSFTFRAFLLELLCW